MSDDILVAEKIDLKQERYAQEQALLADKSFWQRVEKTYQKQIGKLSDGLSLEQNKSEQAVAMIRKNKEPLVESTTKEEVFGFYQEKTVKIPNPELEYAEEENFRLRQEAAVKNIAIKNLNQDMMDFQHQLHQAGLKPIAIIEAKLFKQICLQTKRIFRFEHYSDNIGNYTFIKESGSHYNEVNFKQAVVTYNCKHYGRLAWFCSLLAALFITAAIVFGSGWYVLGIIASIIAACHYGSAYYNQQERNVDLVRFIKKVNKQTLLNALFTEKEDEKSGSRINLKFGQAPDYFIEQLQKVQAANLQPCLAVDYATITVNKKKLIERIEAEIEAERHRGDPCPILYVKSKKGERDFVAILSHFGEFPSEHKVLRWVKENAVKVIFDFN